MKRIMVVVGWVAVGCGGEMSSIDAGEDAAPDAWSAPQCEAGAMQCAGPLQACGRRARTCNDDGTWSEWSCTTGCPAPTCDAIDCSDPTVDCAQCPVRCTITTDAAGAAIGTCH